MAILNTSDVIVLYIGPIQITLAVPRSWVPHLNASFSAWQVPNTFETKHRAHIDLKLNDNLDPTAIKCHQIESSAQMSLWQREIAPSLLEQPTSEDPNEQPDCRVVVDMCIRNVLSSLHVDLHYWLLHAAGIMTGNNKIAVVLGESGAGKTTLFRKLGGYDAGHLHEDLIMVGEGKVYNFPSQSSFSQWEMCKPKWGKLGKIVLLGEREGVGRTSEVQSQDRMQWLMKSIVASHGLEGNASATLDSITRLALTESWTKLHYDKERVEPERLLRLLEGMEPH